MQNIRELNCQKTQNGLKHLFASKKPNQEHDQ